MTTVAVHKTKKEIQLAVESRLSVGTQTIADDAAKYGTGNNIKWAMAGDYAAHSFLDIFISRHHTVPSDRAQQMIYMSCLFDFMQHHCRAQTSKIEIDFRAFIITNQTAWLLTPKCFNEISVDTSAIGSGCNAFVTSWNMRGKQANFRKVFKEVVERDGPSGGEVHFLKLKRDAVPKKPLEHTLKLMNGNRSSQLL